MARLTSRLKHGRCAGSLLSPAVPDGIDQLSLKSQGIDQHQLLEEQRNRGTATTAPLVSTTGKSLAV